MSNANSINAAILATTRAANMKDYKVRSKRNRAMRELARELLKGAGFIVATGDELKAKYPNFFKGHGAEKFIWAVYYNSVWNRLDFAPIDKA